jgi:sugar/nucleoside kinase (ribokinase family)
LAALVKGHTLVDALEWAPINAMSVVQQVGAQGGLLDEEDLLRLLKEAPERYAVSQW